MTNNLSLPARWRFFESYADAIEVLAAQDRRKAKDFLFAIYEFSSWGRDPELDFSDPMTAMAWALIQPNLTSSVERHASGARGGRKKAENARNNQPEGKETDMTNNDMKSVRKMTSAMGKLYQQTVVDDFEYDDVLLPDWIYEEQAEYMSDDYMKRREQLQAEIDAEPWLGAGE